VFTALAISSARSKILASLDEFAFSRPVFVQIQVQGIPDVDALGLFAWGEPVGRPNRVGIEVVRVNIDQILEHSMRLSFELEPEERPLAIDEPDVAVSAEELRAHFWDARPEILRFDATEWRLVRTTEPQPEVQKIDAEGTAVVAYIDPDKSPYRMQCPRCGRLRYGKRRDLPRIIYCHVCTRADGELRRKIKRFKTERPSARRQAQNRRPGGSSELVINDVLHLYDTTNLLQMEIAEKVGYSAPTVSRILKKYRPKR